MLFETILMFTGFIANNMSIKSDMCLHRLGKTTGLSFKNLYLRALEAIPLEAQVSSGGWRIQEKHSVKHPGPSILKWLPCSAATAHSLCSVSSSLPGLHYHFQDQDSIPTSGLGVGLTTYLCWTDDEELFSSEQLKMENLGVFSIFICVLCKFN